jgi:beta-glucanase (GH16 family)
MRGRIYRVVATRRTWVLVGGVAALLVLVATIQNGTSPPRCSNGLNDDPNEDALTDYPSDPGCSSTTDDSELSNPPPEEPVPIAGQGYREVWDDEFDGTALDLTKWKPAWYLRDPGSRNYAVSNGILHLTSRRSEGYRNVELNSVDLASGTPMHYWKGGYFEARAKWPQGRGNWSAFWLNSLAHQIDYQPPYACPLLWSEIDIYENIWVNPQTQWTSLHRNVNGRCGVPDKTRPATTWMRCDTDATSCDLTVGFHTYGVLWEPDRVRWYRDGQLVHSTRYHFTVADVSAFHSTWQDMFLSLWLHSCDWSNRCTDATTPDVIDHQFDWVRVWQK